MKWSYTRAEFQKLDLESKCMITGTILTDDFLDAQSEINFYFPEEDTAEDVADLPDLAPETKTIEEVKFELLINKLTEKLFSEKDKIEFDLEAEAID